MASSYGARRTPRSVMMAVVSAAGVTSSAADLRPLRGAALLDRDGRAVRAVDVDRRHRRGDVERHAVRLRQDGYGVRADLVRRVAVRGDAVGADDDGVERPLLEEVPGHVVGDERDVDALDRKSTR